MSRVAIPTLVGPSNTLRSLQADADRTINLTTQVTQPGTAKTARYLEGTPGLEVFAQFPAGHVPVRGLLNINDRGFAVSGPLYAELFADGTFGPFSLVANDGQPVSMASNGSAGNQVFISAGGLGYIFNLSSGAFTQITASGFPNPVRTVEFSDGYFIAQKGAGSRQVFWSDFEDGTLWDPLDFRERSLASDNITAIKRVHDKIYIVGFRTIEVWYNQGFPELFAPYAGVLLDYGGQGVFTPQRCENTLVWMGITDDGNGIVYRDNNFSPERISTPAVERTLQAAETPTDAFAWTYQMDGHTYYVLTLPRNETAWAYDVTMNQWHEWATWSDATASWFPQRGSCHMFCFNKHLVGDRISGAIYHMSKEFFEEHLVS